MHRIVSLLIELFYSILIITLVELPFIHVFWFTDFICIYNMDSLYRIFILEIKAIVNEENMNLVNNYVNSLKRYISAISKKHYLIKHKNEGMIPKHFLDSLIKLDNAFNNSFLCYKKRMGFFNSIGLKLLNLDIQQAYWVYNKCKSNLLASERTLIEANKAQAGDIKALKDKYLSAILKKMYDKLDKKSNKKHIYKINKPYNITNKFGPSNTKTVIDSPNIEECIRLKKDTVNDLALKYSNLHKKEFVENLTTKHIPNNILNPLSLGDNVNTFPRKLTKHIFSIVADTENILQHLDKSDGHKNGIRNTVSRKINNFMKGKCMHSSGIDRVIKKDIDDLVKFKKNNPNICIMRSDKSKKVAIITKDMYNTKMNELLDDQETYKKIDKDPLVKITNKINNYVRKLHSEEYINKATRSKLTTNAPQHPRIYGLIKLHKDNKPLRPIVNNIKGPTHKLERFFKPFLDNLNTNNPYDVKNAIVVKDKVINLRTINANEKLISFDVVSLFTSIPLELMFEIISEEWEKIEPFTWIKNKTCFIEGLKLICENGFFKYNNNFYRQSEGLPMGGVLSVALSGIVMNRLISDVINTTNIKPKLLMKYVDDLLLILEECEIEIFLNALNGFHSNIRFTYELETDNKIRFLDILIRHENGILRTMWTKNEKSSQRLLNFTSNHPKHVMRNVLNNYIFKAINVTDLKYLTCVKKSIFEIFESNLYPASLINKFWHSNYHRIHKNVNSICNNEDVASSDTVNQENVCSNVKFFSYTYIKGLSEQLNRVFKEYDTYDINLAYRMSNKMNMLYTPLKDIVLTNQQSDVVYEIKCEQCSKVYIGETSQKLHKRLYQHGYDCRNTSGKEPNTALAQHSKALKHTFDFDNARILHKEKNSSKRKIFEAMHIAQNIENSVNFKTDTKNLNQFYAETLHILKKNLTIIY